jgi:hypothetical protein
MFAAHTLTALMDVAHRPASCVLNMFADSPGAAVMTSGPVKALKNSPPHSPVRVHNIRIFKFAAGLQMLTAA